MICRTCLRQAISVAGQRATPPIRTISTTNRIFRPTAAESSTTESPTLSKPVSSRAKATESKISSTSRSSCPAGTVMAGLNYVKGGKDPMALADEEYPDWLWTCLDTNRDLSDGSSTEVGDEYSKSKKQRRSALRKRRKEEQRILEAGDLSALEPKIPLTRQAINLPANEERSVQGSMYAFDSRAQLTRALRRERKANIRETNYLKSM